MAELWPAAEGWQAACVGPLQWLVANHRFKGLESASLDRVVQRNVDPWKPEARALRSFQNEIQMLLHRNPLIEARETRGELVPNSVWISGCGVASGGDLPAGLQIDERLRLAAAEWRLERLGRSLGRAGCRAGGRVAGPVPAGAGRSTDSLRRALRRSFAPVRRSGLQRLWQGLMPPRGNTVQVLEAL